MFYKVKNVEPKENYKLLVTFENGTIKIYDVAQLFDKYNFFKQLQSITGLFEQVKVDIGGFGISWNDEIDISCNELWNNGEIVD